MKEGKIVKELLNKKICNAAIIYSRMVGKEFLVVLETGDVLNLIFKADGFKHLTGVATPLSAQSFYRLAKNNTLRNDQFYFDREHTYQTSVKKLKCLMDVECITTDPTYILQFLKTKTSVYDYAITNNRFTVGLIFKKYKSSSALFPKSLRVEKTSIKKSDNIYRVTYVFSKESNDKLYKTVNYSCANSYLPSCVVDLLDRSIINRFIHNIHDFPELC